MRRYVQGLVVGLCIFLALAQGACTPASPTSLPSPTARLTATGAVPSTPPTQALIPETTVPAVPTNRIATATPTSTPAPTIGSKLSVAEYPLTQLPEPESGVLPFADSVQGDPLTLHAAERKEYFRDSRCQVGTDFGFCVTLGGDRLVAVEDCSDPEACYAVVTRNGQQLYKVSIGPSGGIPGLWGLWTYDGHWAVETVPINTIQSGNVITSTVTAGVVAVDGQSLNDQFRYEETFGFQTLAGKPFYFLKRQGKIDANYAGVDIPLGFDEVPHYYCCSAAAVNPGAHPNLVTFYGRRGDGWYYGEIGVSLSVAAPASASLDEGRIVFTVPVGTQGVQYGAEQTGPMALAVAPDGTFWIADTQGSRLLHYGHQGALLNRIDLNLHGVVGAADVETIGSDVVVLDGGGLAARVLRLTADGKVLATYDIPEGLGPEGGLTGLAVGDHGEILLEFEMGAEIAQLVNAKGALEPVQLPGYSYEGRLYRAQLARGQTSHGSVTAGSTLIELTVPNTLAGLWILAFTPAGDFYVVVEEMESRLARVDQTVRHYEPTGELLGMARVPIADQYTYVSHGLAIGPDGGVYALLTRPDHVEVVRLGFSTETTTPSGSPVTPPAQAGIRPASTETCSDSAKVMQEVLGTEGTTTEAPFRDYISGQTGTGCQVTVTGTGADFGQMGTIAEALQTALQARGWTERTAYRADMPGTSTGWGKSDELCLLAVLWQPSADANCPKDQPISICDIQPEQQLYTITLNCVRMSD